MSSKMMDEMELAVWFPKLTGVLGGTDVAVPRVWYGPTVKTDVSKLFIQ